ncbi:hypothetical protein [Sulfitobacter sp.]|uniref:hypothetical protein n=1 Tax=Sulfitobacter sp. TaxID=1903071 RepID=UPI00300383BE
MSLAPFVRIAARGKGRARAITMAEAQEVMTLVLGGRCRHRSGRRAVDGDAPARRNA